LFCFVFFVLFFFAFSPQQRARLNDGQDVMLGGDGGLPNVHAQIAALAGIARGGGGGGGPGAGAAGMAAAPPAAAPAPAVEPSEDNIAALVAMGFGADEAADALRRTGDDPEAAVGELLQ
jgi:hypothetical protein